MGTRDKRGIGGTLAAAAALITAIGGIVAILVQLGIIGSDSDSGSGSKTTQTVTPATWAAKANEICAKANDDIDALPDPEALDPEALTAAGRESVDILQRQLRELQRLTPPADDAPKVERLLRILAQLNDASEEVVGALRLGDASGIQEDVDEIRRLAPSGDRLANQLGASTCAEGASLAGVGTGARG